MCGKWGCSGGGRIPKHLLKKVARDLKFASRGPRNEMLRNVTVICDIMYRPVYITSKYTMIGRGTGHGKAPILGLFITLLSKCRANTVS